MSKDNLINVVNEIDDTPCRNCGKNDWYWDIGLGVYRCKNCYKTMLQNKRLRL